MKKILLLLLLSITTSTICNAQLKIEDSIADGNINTIESAKDSILTANFEFIVTDTGVNSKQHEYGSGFFKRKFIIISAKKIGGLGGTKDSLTGEPHTQIYCSTIHKTGNLERPLLYSRILNTADNEGTITFTPDNKTVYYTRDLLDGKKHYQLYKAFDSVGRGQWINEKKIHFNSNDYSIENPYLSEDGKTLYFSSDMPGGEGGFDLYQANLNEDGTLDTPKNIGNAVNTPNDEKSPFIDENNKYLYFASNGHNTLGGLDNFRAKNVSGNFVRTLNLGPTINSVEDDYAFMLANEKRGYVTSAKKDGVGGSDVYKFRLKYNKQSIKGIVKDALTQKIIPNAIITAIDTDGNPVIIKTGKDGTFSTYVDPYEIYTITSNQEGYDEDITIVETNSATERNFETTILLNQTPAEIVSIGDKTMIKIENIYFDFNKSSIRSVSRISLKKIATVLNDNPDMKIEVNAHTDIRGTNSYNLALSKRRAKSTMKHLISLGIDSNRMISKGYGESQTLIDCTSKKCTDEEHETNRRIEFVIVQE